MRAHLLKLKNIGDASAEWLIAIGIDSIEQIEELGAAEVYRRLRARVSYLRTLALP